MIREHPVFDQFSVREGCRVEEVEHARDCGAGGVEDDDAGVEKVMGTGRW